MRVPAGGRLSGSFQPARSGKIQQRREGATPYARMIGAPRACADGGMREHWLLDAPAVTVSCLHAGREMKEPQHSPGRKTAGRTMLRHGPRRRAIASGRA